MLRMKRGWTRSRWQSLLAVAAGTSLIVGDGGVAQASPPSLSAASPTVSGPMTGGLGNVVLRGIDFSLSSVGYTQSEFSLSGSATSYTSTTPLDSSGRWQAEPASTAPYTTRMVVHRPANPARFNGTVVVEWLNVTAGFDAPIDWIFGHDELIREGYAWVGVSAQQAGVSGLKTSDPVRYAGLSHPGDSFSYDIFSQAGQAVRDDAAQLLGVKRPRIVLGDGESQSAFRLTTYINAIQPLAQTYDGFLVHSRRGTAAPLSQSPQAAIDAPEAVFFRSDSGVPTINVQTESDPIVLNSLVARQPDSPNFRLWEVAGTAHVDDYNANIGAIDDGSKAFAVVQVNHMLNPPFGPSIFSCDKPINTGQDNYIMGTAIHALNRWVTAGVSPAKASRLKVDTSGATPTYVTDANGNVLGGVRTPAVQVPLATLSGIGNSAAEPFTRGCSLFGTTIPFSAEKLAALYPTHADFVRKWTAATAAGVAAGFILPADAVKLIYGAAKSDVR